MDILSVLCDHLDIIGSRLELGKRLGADYTLTVDPTSQPHANADDIVCLIGCQPDVTLECTGAESCLQTAVYVKFLFLTTFKPLFCFQT